MIKTIGVGKTIIDAFIDYEEHRDHLHEERNGSALILKFSDGTAIKMWDDRQLCCEYRYMRTDDDLSFIVGSVFLGQEVREASPEKCEDNDQEHEVEFLIVNTSKGPITIANHNEHNGYYGGFNLIVEPLEK